MPKHYKMKAEPGHYKLTGQDVKLVHTVTVTAVKRNWPWLSAYFVVTVGGIAWSYFTSEWVSVWLSIGVAAVTFVIGGRMVQQVITITKEVH